MTLKNLISTILIGLILITTTTWAQQATPKEDLSLTYTLFTPGTPSETTLFHEFHALNNDHTDPNAYHSFHTLDQDLYLDSVSGTVNSDNEQLFFEKVAKILYI